MPGLNHREMPRRLSLSTKLFPLANKNILAKIPADTTIIIVIQTISVRETAFSIILKFRYDP